MDAALAVAANFRSTEFNSGGGHHGRLLCSALVALALRPALADEDIVLRGMGSFHVGGRVVEVKGKEVRMIVRQPGGPQTKLDPNGQYMVE